MKHLARYATLLLVLVLTACSNNKDASQTDNLYAFRDYVSYNSYGSLSIAEPIRIELSKSLDQYEVTQEIPSEYIKISPKTTGKFLIENGRTLVFQPDNYLKPGTEYSVTLKLDKLYDDIDKKFRSYTFMFKTITPNFKVNLGNLQSYSKEWQYVTGTIKASDIITLENAKKLLSAKQQGKNISIKWDNEIAESTYFDFKIDSISRAVDDAFIDISWNGDAIDASNKGENEFFIPGQNNFTIISAKATASPQASLTLNFSDPLAEDQNFSGLVAIQNVQSMRFEVDGNVLHVYPSNRVIGNVTVDVFTGIKNTSGFKLKKTFSELISFEQLKPNVRLISKGVILPNSNSTPFYFEAVNLSAVDVRIIKIFEDNMLQFLQTTNINDHNAYNIRRVGRRVAKKTIQLDNDDNAQWKAYALNLSEYFNAEPGALYRIEISYKKEYSTYNCEAASENTEVTYEDEYYEEDYYEEDSYTENPEVEEEREEQYWDNEIYNWRRYSYNWDEYDNPCHSAYYNEDRVITANIMGSDLGFIVKKGRNRSYHFATTNLLTTQPESDVKINLYNFQQQLIQTVTTDNEGFTIFDSEKNVAFAVAIKGNNYAYAKLNDGNMLSLSKFDVSGKQLQKGLKGFIYTERGVHRPGDSIHLTFVLNDAANPLPKDHPVKLEVTDARGKLVQRTVFNGTSRLAQNEESFYYFPIATESEAQAGTWRATIYVGGAQFTKSLRVATIKPNRLKIKLDFDDEILEAANPIEGEASVLWLHGAPARNMKIEMTATIRSTSTAFKDFGNYKFNDPVRNFEEMEFNILDGNLNAEGFTAINKKLDLGNKAPGMLRATFLTKVFEGGGDFSIDVFSKNIAPFTHFVGLQSPKARAYGSYFTDEDTEFDVVSVTPNGKVSGNRTLEVKVFKIEWRWWWNRGNDNLSRYENATIHRPVQSFTVTTKGNGKASFNLNIPEEEGGRYLIRVIDKQSGHATGRVAYFYRNWWKRPAGSDSESAKMLVFSSDKEKYQVGDDAIINFPSGSVGRALISVENGTEVLETRWVETQKGETKVTIPITKEMAPNVYINISLLQPHEQTKNDLPIRLYGVIPLLVEDAATVLNPKIDMADVLKPEENYTITVSEANKKAMTYTVAIVDEGLLDLTRFKTPEIHKAFYTREALGVKTFDIYDFVIGAYSGSVENIYAIGGGDEAAGAKNRKADRFKPVVTYLGPFTLKAGKKATHEIYMPNYVGSVRAMVIAGNATTSAYGNTEKTVPVRKPLMVLASLPRKLSPGETVILPVTVFAMEKKVKNATITVEVGDGLKPINGTSKQVSFSAPEEKIVNFEFEVLAQPGVQTIKVLASGSGENASYDVEIDVVNPNPISQKSTDYTLASTETKTVSFSTFGVAGTNSATLEFSTLPPMDFSKRMKYLISYPHGCVEQTTSSVFPQLFLEDIFDITFDKKKNIEKNIKAAIHRLGNFQTFDGGLSYWPGGTSSNEWGTSYAGHFMIEAKQKGYALPITFMSNWLQFQQNKARQWRTTSARYNSSFIQSYRLYTLALAGKPELAAMNRLRETKHLSNDAKWRLAATYALIGQEKIAKEIAATANVYFQKQEHNYYSYGSPFRNKAMALETLVSLDDAKQRDLAISLAKELSSQRWYSTQETSYALLAMTKMVKKNGGKDLDVSYTQNGKTVTVKTDKALAQREISLTMGENSVSIKSNKGNTVYVRLAQAGKLPLGDELAEQRNLSIRATFVDGEGNKLDISSLRQGTEIIAKIVVNNNSNDYVDNIALSQIFPSGWEIVNTSFTELGGGATGVAEYTDIRDDRVNFYFDLQRRKSKTFTVKLNASYLGTYYLPGSQAEAMYDNNYFTRNKGQWILVEK